MLSVAEPEVATPPAPIVKSNPSTQSCWSYIVDRLIDIPGQTIASLAVGRPDHLSDKSIEAVAFKLAKDGILIREGRGMASLFRVAPNGLDRIPNTWRHEGSPGNGQNPRAQRSHTKGFGDVAKLPPEARAPLSPLKGKPVELPDKVITTPSGKHLIMPPEAPRPAPSPEAVKAAEAKYIGPTVTIVVGGKPRAYPLAVAKEIYRELRAFFEV